MKYLSLLLLFGVTALIEGTQNVSVNGIIVCEKRRKESQLVELWANDSVDPTDLLASVHTDEEGNFALAGSKVGEIAPIVRVTHNCKAKPECARIYEYIVPKNMFAAYDMSFVTLDIYTRDEKEKC